MTGFSGHTSGSHIPEARPLLPQDHSVAEVGLGLTISLQLTITLVAILLPEKDLRAESDSILEVSHSQPGWTEGQHGLQDAHMAPLLQPTSGTWDTSQLGILKEVKMEAKERRTAEENVCCFSFLFFCSPLSFCLSSSRSASTQTM